MPHLSALPIVISDNNSDPFIAGDCDCACPQAFFATQPELPRDAMVERHPQLKLIDLDAEHAVVFVPSISRVAVLNQAARRLLDQLNQPTRLAAAAFPEAAALQQIANLGLLRVVGMPDPRPAAPDQLVVWLHVTNACNLRCTYCYVEKTDEAMSETTAYAAVDAALRSAVAHGYMQVMMKYAGGEASLNLLLVQQAHTYALNAAAQLGIRLEGVVLSNGVGLTRHRLAIIHDLGLKLMISLDGPAAYHDAQRPTIHGQSTHAAASACTLRARDMGLFVDLSITVTGQSAAGLPEVVTWALEHDLRFSLNFYRENDCSADHQELLLDEQRIISGMQAAYAAIEQRLPAYSLLGRLVDRANLSHGHQRTCAVGENYLVIDHHGRIAKCQMELAHPIITVAAADPLHWIRLDTAGVQNIPVEEKEGCRSCEWRYWCTGGCAIATYRATGRYDVRSPNCTIYKSLYPAVVRLEGLRLLKHHQPAFG